MLFVLFDQVSIEEGIKIMTDFLTLVFWKVRIDLFQGVCLRFLDLEFCAFNTINSVDESVSLGALFAVGSLVVIDTVGEVVEAVTFEKVHTEWA